MTCPCQKNRTDGCHNCVNGSVAGATSWIDCSYWTAKPNDAVVLTEGQYVRYTNGSVRTKEGSRCANFTKDGN